MPKWNSGFLDRLKDVAKERLDQRLRQELTPDIQAPELGGQPVPGEENVPQGLLSKIKRTVKDKVLQLSPVQQRMLDDNAPLDEATIRYRIQYAGQNHLLLLMRYNNQWRHVEPYSYRTHGQPDKGAVTRRRQQIERARTDPSVVIEPMPKKTILFYGFCRVHDEIHAFDPKKIQGLIVTEQVFQPRWPIEV